MGNKLFTAVFVAICTISGCIALAGCGSVNVKRTFKAVICSEGQVYSTDYHRCITPE